MPVADRHDGLVLTRSGDVDADLQGSTAIRNRTILCVLEPGQRNQRILGLGGKLTAHAGFPLRGLLAPLPITLVNPAPRNQIGSWLILENLGALGEVRRQRTQMLKREALGVRGGEGVDGEGFPA